MAAQSLIDAGQAPIIAYNNKDWKAAKDCISASYVYDEVGSQRKVQGADDLSLIHI